MRITRHANRPMRRATKRSKYRKRQGGNIYAFELVWGSAKGEETSKPELIYRDRGQANYESAK